MKFLFDWLVPPGETAPPEQSFRWRIAVSAAVALMTLHVAWACGWLPGDEGFAYASDVREVKYELAATRAEILEERLFAVRLRQCSASTSEAKQFYRQKIGELLVRYRTITGSDYSLPACNEVQ